MLFSYYDFIYTGIWASIGSILSFLSFRYKTSMSIKEIFFNLFISVGVGLLIAFPIIEYLCEVRHMPKKFSITFGALATFGLIDVILKYYTTIAKVLISKIAEKLIDRTIFKN